MSKSELIGDRELLRQLRRIHDQAPKETQKALREWSADTQDLAQAEAPVGPSTPWHAGGTLRESINRRVRKLNAEVGIWGAAFKEAYYAQFVHEGTSMQSANPFLLRAFRRNEDVRPYMRRLVERLLP